MRHLFAKQNREQHGALRRRRKETSLSARQGLVLVLGISALVTLTLILVYYVWYLPVQKSLQ